MYTLTIAQAISIALLSVCHLAPPGLPAISTDIFGAHQLTTEYGLMDLQIDTADENYSSVLSIGSQHILIKGAPLGRILEFMDLPIAPCPATAYDFGPTPSEDHQTSAESATEQALRAEVVNFKISCSDCELENLQEIAYRFLESKISNEARETLSFAPPLLSQQISDQTNR